MVSSCKPAFERLASKVRIATDLHIPVKQINRDNDQANSTAFR